MNQRERQGEANMNGGDVYCNGGWEWAVAQKGKETREVVSVGTLIAHVEQPRR